MHSAHFHHLCYIVTKITVDEFWTESQTALPIYYSRHFYPHYPPYLFLTGIPNHAKVKSVTFSKALLLLQRYSITYFAILRFPTPLPVSKSKEFGESTLKLAFLAFTAHVQNPILDQEISSFCHNVR